MRSLAFVLLFVLLASNHLSGQSESLNREGFIFGLSIGASSLKLNLTDQNTDKSTVASFPNLKFGKMISNKVAILAYLPGTVYEYNRSGRTRARGFEAILPSAQIWIKDRTWVMGGFGIGMDAPAFFDIKSEEERKFYFGYATAFSIGHELLQRGNKTIDLQARIHYGSINTDDGDLSGLAVSFLVGFNLY